MKPPSAPHRKKRPTSEAGNNIKGPYKGKKPMPPKPPKRGRS